MAANLIQHPTYGVSAMMSHALQPLFQALAQIGGVHRPFPSACNGQNTRQGERAIRES